MFCFQVRDAFRKRLNTLRLTKGSKFASKVILFELVYGAYLFQVLEINILIILFLEWNTK